MKNHSYTQKSRSFVYGRIFCFCFFLRLATTPRFYCPALALDSILCGCLLIALASPLFFALLCFLLFYRRCICLVSIHPTLPSRLGSKRWTQSRMERGMDVIEEGRRSLLSLIAGWGTEVDWSGWKLGNGDGGLESGWMGRLLLFFSRPVFCPLAPLHGARGCRGATSE